MWVMNVNLVSDEAEKKRKGEKREKRKVQRPEARFE